MSDLAQFLLMGLAALAAIALMVATRRKKATPEETERLRRASLEAYGKVRDGMISDAYENAIFYNYSVGGMAYSATQDVTPLLHLLPEDPGLVLGPAGIKYDPRNPANSIVISENWSGVRGSRPATKNKY